MPHNVFIEIDYDEMKPVGSYKGVVITPPQGDEVRFNTGDPVADFRSARDKGVELANQFGCRFMQLSSLSHFVFDVPGYRYDDNDMLVVDHDLHDDGVMIERA